jgi:hypothetical protein
VSLLAVDAIAVAVLIPVVLRVLTLVVGPVPGVVGLSACVDRGSTVLPEVLVGAGLVVLGVTAMTVPPPRGMAFEVGSFWVGQVWRMRSMASRSASVTQRWYLTLTATCGGDVGAAVALAWWQPGRGIPVAFGGVGWSVDG